MSTSEPRVWIGCLAAYNAGTLYGEWVDVPNDPKDLAAEVARVLAGSPAPDAEEHGWLDCEALPGIGEHASFEEVCATARAVRDHGLDVVAAAAKVADSSIADIGEWIEDHYSGTHDDAGAWAAEQAEDCYGRAELGPFADYIDWDAVARDADLNGDISLVEDGSIVHVFRTT